MIVEHSAVKHFVVSDVPMVGPIDVFIEDFVPGKGRITLQCYGDAWTAYFGAMGGKNIEQFVGTCGADYLANKFLGNHHKRTKGHEKYLTRIVEAVKAAILGELKPEEIGATA